MTYVDIVLFKTIFLFKAGCKAVRVVESSEFAF
jgi:hypothetical protein